jgi:hypothetical protein
MPTEKDYSTEALRQKVLVSNGIIETENADCGLTTLSFQSVLMSNRHVWVDTEGGGQVVVDLEDWLIDDTWDNSIAHFTTPDLEIIARIIINWLNGSTIDECALLGGDVWPTN